MGKCDKKQTEAILDYFYEAGGNFIDTANNYQDEESEIWIGDWMKRRGNRDEMVIATKFTTPFRAGKGDDEIIINTAGKTIGDLIFYCFSIFREAAAMPLEYLL